MALSSGAAPDPSPWAAPDTRPARDGTAFGGGGGDPEPSPPLWQDVRAGLLTVAITVLVGAPVGLLWAALAPRVTVEVTGEDVRVVDDHGDSFIAVDGAFFAAVVVAGLVGGLLAWKWGSRHGPAVVLGLAAGGVAAAWIAQQVGGQVDYLTLEELTAGGDGRRELAVRLRSASALLGWPIASLLVFLALTAATGPRDEPEPVRSSGSPPVSSD